MLMCTPGNRGGNWLVRAAISAGAPGFISQRSRGWTPKHNKEQDFADACVTFLGLETRQGTGRAVPALSPTIMKKLAAVNARHDAEA